MAEKPKRWDEKFDKEFFSQEEIKESDERVAEMQKVIEKAPEPEVVLNGLKCILTGDVPCDRCNYGTPHANRGAICKKQIASEAITLLERLVPKAPFRWRPMPGPGRPGFPFCPNPACTRGLEEGQPVCVFCGQAVKWE